jgi:serine/threonine protein kinase
LKTEVGTAKYMAPEISGYFPRAQLAHTRRYTAMVDIWSLGMISHELFTGNLPFWNPIPSEPDEDYSMSGIDHGPCDDVLATSFEPREFLNYCEGSRALPDNHLNVSAAPDIFKDFIISLLRPNPTERPEACIALKHPWITRTMAKLGTALSDLFIARCSSRRVRLRSALYSISYF